MLVQIAAPHFTAGLDLENNRVVAAAPIIGYMKGWNITKVRLYSTMKGWELHEF